MRAVLISPDPSTNAGGVERFCSLMRVILESAGWSTTVIGPRSTVPRPLGRFGLQPSLQAASVARRARSERPNLVISNGFLGGPTCGKRIHVFHGTMIRHVWAGATGSRRYRLREAVGGAVPEAICGRGATVVAVSNSTAAELRTFYRQPVDAVIPNGVDTELFAPGDRAQARAQLELAQDTRYALFVGRFEHRKGADLVPEACDRAGFKLVVAGPSAPSSAIALGTLSPARLALAYQAADCVAFPTRYEACSFVVLEALASGVPLITTSVGWMHDFLGLCPGYTRFIVRPDVQSITSGLMELTDSDCDPLLAQARTLVQRHNGLEAFGRRWLELIAGTMSR